VLSKQKKADIALILVTIFWGASYVVADYVLTVLHPFRLSAIRFVIAFLLSSAIFRKHMKGISKSTVKYAFIIGAFLAGVYAFTNFGMLHTNLTNVGFIVALPVVFTPMINYFFRGICPSRKLVLVLILATAGMALMTLDQHFVPALGDILCLFAAIFYAADIVLTEVAVQREDVNALQLGILILGAVALIMSTLTLFFDNSQRIATPDMWAAIFFLAVFSTAFAFIVQSVAQQYTNSVHVGLIFTLEPIFAAAAAFWVLGEVLLPRAYVGAALMLLAVLWSEVDVTKLFNKKC
jgi:drug/metabolite transporter (DMT)-like permease